MFDYTVLLLGYTTLILCPILCTQSILFISSHPCCWLSFITTVLLSSIVLILCCCVFVCLNLILIPLPAAHNTNTNPDIANFDAFGGTSGSTCGFPSAPQATFQPTNAGRASSHHWMIKTLAYIIMFMYVLRIYTKNPLKQIIDSEASICAV